MGDAEWSFYNVKEEQSATMQMVEQELTSASPSSSMMQMDDSPSAQIDTGEARESNFQIELEQQACGLQTRVTESNVEGNEFNRQEAEALIETDFQRNDAFLKN